MTGTPRTDGLRERLSRDISLSLVPVWPIYPRTVTSFQFPLLFVRSRGRLTFVAAEAWGTRPDNQPMTDLTKARHGTNHRPHATPLTHLISLCRAHNHALLRNFPSLSTSAVLALFLYSKRANLRVHKHSDPRKAPQYNRSSAG